MSALTKYKAVLGAHGVRPGGAFVVRSMDRRARVGFKSLGIDQSPA